MGTESRFTSWGRRIAVVNFVFGALWLIGALYLLLAGPGLSSLVVDSAVDLVRSAVMVVLVFGPPAVLVASSVFLLRRSDSAGVVR